MAVEYDISSDVAVIKETGSVSQCARVTQMYSGQITYDDEAGSKFATATINGKSQRVMLCIAVSGTVTYDDVPSLYSTVDGHRCLNIVTPTETGTPDDVPSLYETVVIDGQNVRAVRCIMINKTPVYDGVSSTCTFTGDDGKTHTAQLVNKITGGSVQVIIKGTSPLNLPDAVANSLRYVKAFGGTEQNGTPTPTNPVDIVSNNGVLKARHQSGLPLGYTQLEYIQSTGTQYLSIPYRVNNKTVFYCRYNEQSNGPEIANAIFGVTDSPDSKKANNGILRLTGNGWNRMGWGDNTNGSIRNVSAPKVFDTWYELLYDQNKLYQDGILYATSATEPSTVWSANYDLGIFVRASSSVSMYARAKISSVWAKEDGEYVFNLVPAKNSSNIIGMYDTVSGTFFTNAGTDDFIAGPNAVGPITIVTDGTVETIEDTIGNTATAEMLLKVGDYQDEQEILSGAVTRNVGVKVLDGTENFETATATNCYSLTNTLGTGNFADRTIVCSHFANTPTMPGTGDRQGLAFIVNKGPEYTIAFGATTQFSTQALWKQWLADQYAAGTPVTVIYPLAQAVTEQVAPQVLNVQTGDNILEITQASLSGLELEAKYSKNS